MGASLHETAACCIGIARIYKSGRNQEGYKRNMRTALSYINQIPNPEHRKKYVSMWFAAFNKTNNELRK